MNAEWKVTIEYTPDLAEKENKTVLTIEGCRKEKNGQIPACCCLAVDVGRVLRGVLAAQMEEYEYQDEKALDKLVDSFRDGVGVS